jgi:hypothetical protein
MTRVAAGFAAVAVACGLALPLHSQSPVLIRGQVVSAETGDPLVHARVVVFNDATPLPAMFADAQGQFSSAPLPPGRYRLTVTKPGYALTTVTRLPADGVIVRMPRSSAIAGRVVDGFGEPAAGVQMQLFARGSDRTKPGPLVKGVSTDDLGEYRFGGLTAGLYVVGAVILPGLQFIPNDPGIRPVSYYPGVATVADAQDLDLHPGDEKLGVDFAGLGTQLNDVTATLQIVMPNIQLVGPNGQSLRPTPIPGTGVIRGRVTRTDGLPLARVTVSTQAPQSVLGRTVNAARSVQTDDDGRYEIGDLPAGEYRVAAAKLGYVTLRYGQREDSDQGVPVDLADSQTRTRIDIALPRYSNVTGRVVDEFGDPVEGAAVTLSQIKFQTGRKRLVSVSGMSGRMTDDLGRYRIYAVPPGEYVVGATVGQVVPFQPVSGVTGYATTYFPSTVNPREGQLVSVPRSQDVTAVDLVLVPTPTATISGRKVGSDGRPFGGALFLNPSQRSGAIVTPGTGARIYNDGRFEFPNVAPGDYVIQADEGKKSPDREGQFAWALVTVDGGDVPDVLLESTPGSTISGRVVFEGDGPPVQSLSISPVRADADRAPLSNGSIVEAEVRSDLRFFMMGVHGPRRITVPRAPSGWMLKSVSAKGVDVTDVALPFGTSAQSLTDVQVVMTSQVTELSGAVVDIRGEPAVNYTLLVFPVDRDRWYPGSRFFRRAAPASSGNFSVRGLPPSDYFVAPVAGWSVLKDGADAWQDPEFLESIALRAARATLTEGGRVALSAKVIAT